MIGASDEEQLKFAVSQGRVIFTQDDDFLKLHQKGFSHPGIAYCRQRSRSIGEIINSLTLLWELVEPQEIWAKTEFL